MFTRFRRSFGQSDTFFAAIDPTSPSPRRQPASNLLLFLTNLPVSNRDGIITPLNQSTMNRSIPVIGALAALLMTANALSAATSSQEILSPDAIGQISPTEVTFPAGGPNFYPGLYVGGNTFEGGAPTRIAMEFPIGDIADLNNITAVTFGATTFGGARGSGLLQYSLFGYFGSGLLGLDSGLGGQFLAGPFQYDIDFSAGADLSNIDVTHFIRSAVMAGEDYAGFVLRDVNTAPNFATDRQLIVVQDSPSWGGDVPPTLTITAIPEPSTSLLALLGLSLIALRRRRR
jgi:hypothetical protein